MTNVTSWLKLQMHNKLLYNYIDTNTIINIINIILMIYKLYLSILSILKNIFDFFFIHNVLFIINMQNKC